MKKLLFIAITLVYLASCKSPSTKNSGPIDFIKTETPAEKNERMQWWRDAGMGMFIHWGLYAVPAGEYGDEKNHAEWIQESANIPVEEYEKYADQFNPVKYNAEDWVKMAKDAGMKYIVITSKHHDGFCLWDSKVSDYDIMDRTPYKKDLLKDLAEACQKEGIILCFYHSIMDWHHPQAQGINYPDYNKGTGPNPEFPAYVENYLYPQLEELLSNYGKIGVIWFDGEWITEWTEDQGKDLYNYLRNIQPNLIINNRVGKGRQGMEGMNAYEDAAGDFGTPEQEILDGSSSLDWESCMTMNDHWGFNQFDQNFKSSEMLIHNLVDIAAKGGNYLLNVGPTAEGLFPEESISRLKEIGEWMKINGEVIHNSRGTKHYKEAENIYYIQSNDGENLYAVLTKWPGNSVILKYADPNAGSEITLLGYDQALNWTDNNDAGILIELPKEWEDENNRPVKYAFVIKMQGKQALVLDAPEMFLDSNLIENKTLFSDKALVELSSPSEGAVLYYTLDGSEPTTKSNKYYQAVELMQSTTVKAIAVKDDFVNSPITVVDFMQAKVFGSVEYEFPYSSKYAALGNLSIGDGEFGTVEDYTTNWLGFEGVDFHVSIDLGEKKAINSVKIDFLENIKSWIFLPENIEIKISDDGINFKSIKKLDVELPNSKRKANTQLFEIAFSTEQTRYVQIIAKNIASCPEWHPGAGGKAWLFVDEVVVE